MIVFTYFIFIQKENNDSTERTKETKNASHSISLRTLSNIYIKTLHDIKTITSIIEINVYYFFFLTYNLN